jgi:RNAse (barnase) inhibitor barstar
VSQKVLIDWKKIKNKNDFYKDFFSQTEAPNWHGENLNAVNDSMVTGSICEKGPPFSFEIKNNHLIKTELFEFAKAIEEIFHESVKNNGGTLIFS